MQTINRGQNASQERKVLYDLLNSEGSLEAQKVLLVYRMINNAILFL